MGHISAIPEAKNPKMSTTIPKFHRHGHYLVIDCHTKDESVSFFFGARTTPFERVTSSLGFSSFLVL